MSSTACDDQHKPDLYDMQDALGDAWGHDRQAVIDEMARVVEPMEWRGGGHMRYAGHTISWGEYIQARERMKGEEEAAIVSRKVADLLHQLADARQQFDRAPECGVTSKTIIREHYGQTLRRLTDALIAEGYGQ